MRNSPAHTAEVTVKVQEVLPQTGLAFVADDQGHSWALTNSMAGQGLARLREGQSLRLTLEAHPDFTMVSAYAELD